MEVKDVQLQTVPNPQQVAEGVKSKQKPISHLTEVPEKSLVSEHPENPVEIHVDHGGDSHSVQFRKHANEIFNAINITSQASEEVEKLVESINGIVEQAVGYTSSKPVDDKKISILEDEAKNLVQEIHDRLQSMVSAKIAHTPTQDPIRMDIEKRLGKTLETLLPEHRKDIQIGDIALSQAETIINVQTHIARAKEHIEKFSKNLKETREQVLATLRELEIAYENKSAVSPSIRDVDAAVGLAQLADKRIRQNPDEALSSVGQFNMTSKELLF